MKKLLLIFIFFISCTAEDNQLTCDCQKETWLRYNGGAWYHNGYKEYYSNDCSDDGDVIGGHSGQGYDFEYRIKCK